MDFIKTTTTLLVAGSISLVAMIFFPANPLKAEALSHYLSQSPIMTEIGNPTITSIRQSSDGFMWLGTQHGLYRFDGANVTHFSNNRRSPIRLPFSDIRGITEDPYENLLVATFGGGIFRLSLDSGKFEPLAPEALSDHLFIQHIYHLDNGYLVFTSDNRVSILRENLLQEESWIDSNELYKEIIDPGGVAAGINGEVMIGSDTGLYVVSPESQTITKVQLKPLDEEITALVGDNDNHIVFSTATGFLVKYSLTTKSIVKKIAFKKGPDRGVTDLAIFNGYIWIGTDSGLLQADMLLSMVEDYNIDNSLLFSNHITSLYVSDDTLWIGSFKGLNTIRATPFSTFNQKNSYVFDDVLSFEKDESGDLWVGTYNGLYRRSQGSLTHERFEDKNHPAIGHRPVMAIAASEHEVWLGLWRDGVRIMNTKSNTIRRLETPFGPKLAVTGIFHIGQKTWVSTYDYGLITVDRNSLTVVDTPISDPVTAVLNIDNNHVLVASDKKFYLVSDSESSVTQLDPWDGAVHPPLILSLKKNARGDILVGTKDQGLFIWKAPDFEHINFNLTRYTTTSDINDITIYAMEVDTSGNLWCATEQGLLKLSNEDGGASRFTKANGLQGDNFNSGASYIDSQGTVYFGGVNGYSSFSPNKVNEKGSPSEMALTQIGIPTRNHKIYNPKDLNLIELSNSDYLVSFTFSVLDFTNPKKNKFRYMLEGFDPMWIENGNRNTATYTNLPPGKYTFRAQGANSSDTWNTDGISLSVVVLPAPWLTWWAYLLYGIAVVLVARVVIHIRHTNAAKRNALKEVEYMAAVADKVEDDLQENQEEHDCLIQAVRKHKLSTLALITSIIRSELPSLKSSKSKELAIRFQKQMSVLGELEECYFYQADELVANLNQLTNTLISKKLHETELKPESIMSTNAVTDKLVSADIASPVALILDELLDNSLTHAFSEKLSGRFIKIDFDFEEPSGATSIAYKLSVSDNGSGIDSSTSFDHAKTTGFLLIQAMVDTLEGSISIASKNGTTISISFTSDH